jgi:hypothetical protein
VQIANIEFGEPWHTIGRPEATNMLKRRFVYAGESWSLVRLGLSDPRGLCRARVFFLCKDTGETLSTTLNPFRLEQLSDDALAAALSAAFERADAVRDTLP